MLWITLEAAASTAIAAVCGVTLSTIGWAVLERVSPSKRREER